MMSSHECQCKKGERQELVWIAALRMRDQSDLKDYTENCRQK